jgi:predicted PurR-regulated permease PerM
MVRKNVSKHKNFHSYPKYLFLIFFIAVLAIAVLIVRPYISTLIVSALIVYILYPVYSFLCNITKMKRLSAVMIIAGLLTLLLISLSIAVVTITKESYDVYKSAKSVFLEESSFENLCVESDGFVCDIYFSVNNVSEKYDLDLGFHLARGFSSIATSFVNKSSDFVLNIPKLLLHIFISLFAMYYMFIGGKSMLDSMENALPMSKAHSEKMIKQFNDIISATIYGAIVIAIIQGILAGIGYFIFGVSSPLVFGLLTLISAFIPFVGAALVWFPVSVSMFVSGFLVGDNAVMMKAGGLFLFCALVVSTIDNFLRPKLVGEKAKVHPLVILLGVFGGLAFFGFVGIIIGPLILTLFMASLKIYQQEKEYFQ